jgi:hypothetical protein
MYILFEDCKDFYDLIKNDLAHCKVVCYFVETAISQENLEGLCYISDTKEDSLVLFGNFNDYKEFESKACIVVESKDNENFSIYIQKEVNKGDIENIRKFINIIFANIE